MKECLSNIKQNLFDQKLQWLNSVTFNIVLSNVCNIDCFHCFREHKLGHMEYDLVQSIANQINSDFQTQFIFLIGGEVLLHPKFSETIDSFKKKNITPSLVSNGLLLNEKLLSYLNQNNCNLTISLDGSINYHDYIRNKKGSFNAVQRNLESVKKLEMDINLICCVTKKNINDIDFMVDFSIKHNVKSLRFQPVSKLGAAMNLDEQGILLDQPTLKILYDKLLTLSAKYPGKIKITGLGLFKRDVDKHGCMLGMHFGAGCHSNSNPWPQSFSILINGDVIPFLPEISKNYCIGNIKSQSLFDIVDSFYSSTTHMEILNKIKKHFITKNLQNTDIFIREEFLSEALC